MQIAEQPENSHQIDTMYWDAKKGKLEDEAGEYIIVKTEHKRVTSKLVTLFKASTKSKLVRGPMPRQIVAINSSDL